MANSNRHRATLLDLLVLIAATALGLALVRISIRGFAARPPSRTATQTVRSITMAETYASCLLAPWSLVLLALSLWRPKISFRRMARGPGFMACAAATAGVALYLAVCSTQVAMGRLSLEPATISRITASFATYAPLMVAGAWLSVVLGSRWRAETSWVGWAGRGLGIGWIGLFLLGWLRIFV